MRVSISAVHAGSPSHEQTDWGEITLLYRRLYEHQPSWVIKLNEIVALSFAEGADTALARLTELEDLDRLQRYQPYWAARADLLRRAGRGDEAAEAYRRALELTQNLSERRFLEERLRSLGE